MSRGPGRIERTIRALLDANPDESFSTDQLCNRCYGRGGWMERKHRVAVIRAMHGVLKDDPDWRCGRSNGRSRRMICYNAASLLSTAQAFAPSSVYHEMLGEAPDPDDPADDDDMRAWRLEERARIEGWVAAHIRWRDATPEERAAIEREEEAERERGRGAISALFA
jgi:hypothetical protein